MGYGIDFNKALNPLRRLRGTPGNTRLTQEDLELIKVLLTNKLNYGGKAGAVVPEDDRVQLFTEKGVDKMFGALGLTGKEYLMSEALDILAVIGEKRNLGGRRGSRY